MEEKLLLKVKTDELRKELDGAKDNILARAFHMLVKNIKFGYYDIAEISSLKSREEDGWMCLYYTPHSKDCSCAECRIYVENKSRNG